VKTGKLTARAIQQAKRRGYYNDGGGLYLRVAEGGSKSWVFRFKAGPRLREMGWGSVATLSLQEAREKARECRKLRLDGIDPIEHRKATRTAATLGAAKVMTFKEAAEAYVATHRDSWKNEKHRHQWLSTAATYAYPTLGTLPVQTIDVDLVLKVLQPIWKVKTETASRLRGRIENILAWATVRKYRQGENPARWRGHLDQLLPRPGKVQNVEHHAALPYAAINAFMAELRQIGGAAAQALELTILTATRTSEVLGAKWQEIDLIERAWTIPAERMKAGREHRVPLSDRAFAIIEERQRARESDFVFAGGKTGRPLSNMAMMMLLRRIGRGDLTVHGFRSSFRDWAAETTNFPRDVCEMALAHTIDSRVEAAYRRGDLFRKRRQLMEAWARYCALPGKAGEKVVALQRR
jgi:integrase